MAATSEAAGSASRATTPKVSDVRLRHGDARVGDSACSSSTEEEPMAESVYRVTEVIGVSSESWEAAARAAVETAAKTVRDLRVAEVVRQDLTIGDGGVVSFRVRLGMSFKYGTEE